MASCTMLNTSEDEAKAAKTISDKIISDTLAHNDRNLGIRVLQEPEHALACARGSKFSTRKPIDPPVIAEIYAKRETQKSDYQFRQDPQLLCMAYLREASTNPFNQDPTRGGDLLEPRENLTGILVASPYPANGQRNEEQAILTFGELFCLKEGRYQLELVLSRLDQNTKMCEPIASTLTQTFTVHNNASFPGLAQSTSLTKNYATQGIRLRIRKDSTKQMTRKRNIETAGEMEKKRDEQNPHPYKKPRID